MSAIDSYTVMLHTTSHTKCQIRFLSIHFITQFFLTGRERGGREGGRERGREGGREKGGREGGRERDGDRDRERETEKETILNSISTTGGGIDVSLL